jgi:hypothetical protein
LTLPGDRSADGEVCSGRHIQLKEGWRKGREKETEGKERKEGKGLEERKGRKRKGWRNVGSRRKEWIKGKTAY